jgi:alpha-L-fucosidase 2
MEMLLQCTGGVIHILPALPSALDHGSVRGMRAKGGFELSFNWDKGILIEMTLRSDLGGVCRLGYRTLLRVRGADGAAPEAPRRRPDGVTEFHTAIGATYTIRPEG